MEKGAKVEVRMGRRHGLLDSQLALFNWYREFWGREGRAPRLREAAEAFGSSVESMGQRIRWLRKRGLVAAEGGEGGGWAERAGEWGILPEWLRAAGLFPVVLAGGLVDGKGEAGDLILFERHRLPEAGDLVQWARIGERPGLWVWGGGQGGMRDAYREGGIGDQAMRPARPAGVAVLRVARFVPFPGGRKYLTEADLAIPDPEAEAVGRISVDTGEGV